MILSPLNQFAITSYGLITININNMFMILSLIVIILYSYMIFNNKFIIANNYVIDLFIKFTLSTIKSKLGLRGNSIIIIILNLNLLLLLLNYLGGLPYSYATTAQLALSLYISNSLILTTLVISIIKYQEKIFLAFIPIGTPLWLLPLLFIIEVLSYLARAVSLGLRLSANLISGHSLMFILSGFIITLLNINVILPLIVFLVLLILYLMELFISILQYYVFGLLSLTYFQNGIYLH